MAVKTNQRVAQDRSMLAEQGARTQLTVAGRRWDNPPVLTRLLLARTPDTSFALADAGPGRLPYTCTFHWLPIADGRVIGLDVIRSDDCGRLGLRVFVFERGAIRALVHDAPVTEWASFATDERPALDGERNVLGRGPGWVAGSVGGPGPSISRVRFAFEVRPAAPGLRLRPPLGHALRLTATDYLDARTTGFIELDGERLEIDARGPLSVHQGLRLTRYAYAAAVPRGAEGVRLVSATVGGDSLRVGGACLGGAGITYGFGAQGLPERSLRLGRPGRDVVLGGGRRLILEQVVTLPHTLLGEPTVAGFARAKLEIAGRVAEELDVLLDNRGEPFASLLGP
jgi:hypothetical protein